MKADMNQLLECGRTRYGFVSNVARQTAWLLALRLNSDEVKEQAKEQAYSHDQSHEQKRSGS